ncbi:unnamed protein product [Chrysodeixis includens]|uniref:Nose resistant-to-fluoxetine protein N-terminal domain-containing protein n=1 Tax=Chrysodeixis includens TaxID=689277 RepID=A0A9P0BMK7_CHRIL|nr:unnamed protein product [Chrysodeixis includens]
MVSKMFLILVLVHAFTVVLVEGSVELTLPNDAFDNSLYEDALDPELCDEQIRFIRTNAYLTAFFADAGIRIPKGVLHGNTVEMGNYYQCIGLNQQLPNFELQGKYCTIQVPLNQSFESPLLRDKLNIDPDQLYFDDNTVKILTELNALKTEQIALNQASHQKSLQDSPFSALTLNLGICIPKPCTTRQALNSFLNTDISALGFQYRDNFCRLPNDKPWVPGDTVIVVIFSLIGLITVISTSYDVYQTVILKNDPKTVSVIKRSFSVYTNGRRLMTFSSGPGTIECLDGIRALAMAWVVLGHTFGAEGFWANPIVAYTTWSPTWRSIWVRGAHITVDTFFTLSGFLVVYTTAGKLTGMNLLKNIHLFWLNRLLRMFPLLATVVLWEATYLNHMSDGPYWAAVANRVEVCRAGWWTTLLHIQNYANPSTMCIGQAWYLAIDVQLHIISPIILFWVLLGNKRIAWGALFAGLLAILAASTTYIFIKEFQAVMMSSDAVRQQDYLSNYYINTLTRASPFFVGMVFGYLVKTTKLQMSQLQAVCCWFLALSLSTFIMYTNYPLSKPDWDPNNQVLDNLHNSFLRPSWAMFIGSMIYLCVNGYGGPINWFLSLSFWKIHSRLSYGIYLFHSALQLVVNYTSITPVLFSVGLMTFKFLGHYTLAFIVSFLATLIIDAPCSTLFKLLLGGGPKKPNPEGELESSKKTDIQQLDT